MFKIISEKYTKWYIANKDKVIHSFILCVVHFLLFSPIAYYEITGDIDSYYEWLHSPP